MKRRERRQLTLYSLRIVVTTFFLVNFYLLAWELTRYVLNYSKEPSQWNCNNNFDSVFINNFMVFLSLFQQTQMEMILTLVILWKKYRV